MSTSAKDGWAQLTTLRKLVTEPADALHEAQVLQLRYWPFVAAPHIKRHETSWDVRKKLVTVKADAGEKCKAPKDLGQRMRALLRSVQDMLGETWQVVFFIDKKVIFDSRKKTNGTSQVRRTTRTTPGGRVKRARA